MSEITYDSDSSQEIIITKEELLDKLISEFSYECILVTENIRNYISNINFLSKLQSHHLLNLLIETKNTSNALSDYDADFLHSYNSEIIDSYRIVSELFRKAKKIIFFNTWVEFCSDYTW